MPGDDRSERVEDVLARLRRNGGRVTKARQLLLEELFDRGGHRTAEELAGAVQDRAPEVHLSTIYRNLDELERLGVVTHSHMGHGPAAYHLAETAHPHLVCERCGSTIDVPDEVLGGLMATVRRRYGFAIDPHHFAIPGRCRACSGDAGAPARG